MKLRKKKIKSTQKFKFKKKKIKFKTVESTSGNNPLEALYEFQSQLLQLRQNQASQTQIKHALTARHVELFDEYLPTDIPLTQVRYKIAYRLMYLGYKRTGIPMPSVLKDRYKAAMTYQVDKFPRSLQTLIQCQIETERNKEEQEMKVKKKTTKKIATKKGGTKKGETKKVKRGSVTEAYQTLFSANQQAKLSDVKLAAALNKLFPESRKANGYTVDDIKKVRNMYNDGKLSTQAGKKPKVALEEVTGKKKSKK